jgi:hypothetical protein
MITLGLIFTMLLFIHHQLVLHFDFFPFNSLEGVPFKIRTIDSLISGAICLFTLLALRLEDGLLIAIASGMLAMFSLKELRYSITRKSFELHRMILLLLLILSLLFTLLSYLFNQTQQL